MVDVRQKVIGGLAAMAAGFVATKAIALGWRAVTGAKPPEDPDDPEISIAAAVGFAALSGALIGVARVLAGRTTRRLVAPSIKNETDGVIEK